jgi:hypothetical protein
MRKLTGLSMLVALAVVGAAGAAMGQDMTPEKQQAMMKALAPGEHHDHLARFAGKYEYTSKMWMAPGAPPAESKGTSDAEMIMGGRYLQDVVDGDAMGMPFKGMGLTGYDNLAGEYTFAWIDNMGTGIMRGSGKCSADGTVLTLEGALLAPGAPDPLPFRQVVTLVDDDHHKMEWYMPSEQGEMFKTMELNYTRVK